MKKYLILFVLLLSAESMALAQDFWLKAYTYVDNVSCFDFYGDYVWYGTSAGGVCRYNKTTGEHTVYTNVDGVASNYIRSIYVGSKGDVWIGTDNDGVSHFDGLKWTPFQDKNRSWKFDAVNAFLEDKDGNLWIVNKGIVCMQGENVIYSYSFGSEILKIALNSKNNVWCVTKGGFQEYDGVKWKLHLPDNVRSYPDSFEMKIDKNDFLWYPANGGYLGCYDGTNWISREPPSGQFTGNKLMIGNDGNLRVINGSSLYRLNDENEWEKLSVLGFTDIYLAKTILGIDENDTVWSCNTKIGDSEKKGLWYYDGQTWKNLLFSKITNKSIYSIAEDKNGVLWFGADYQGITSYDGENWEKYYIFAYNIKTIFVDNNNNKWFGYSGGVAMFNGTKWTYYFPHIGEINSIVEDDKGVLWFGGYGGLVTFDGTTWISIDLEKLGFLSNRVLSIAISPDGVMWFGTNKYIYSYDGTECKMYKPYGEENGDAEYSSLVFDDYGILWCLMGPEPEILRYNGINWKNYTEKNSPLNDQSPYGKVTSLAVDKYNVLWIGTRYGIAYGIQWYWLYDNLWYSYGSEVGWPQTNTNVVFVDSKNIKWIGTDEGIYQLYDKSAEVEQPLNTEIKETDRPQYSVSSFPNPFNPSTTISYSVQKAGHVSLSVYNITGQKVATLVNSQMTAGNHLVQFDGSALASGIYFYLIEAGKFTKTGKMLLVK